MAGGRLAGPGVSVVSGSEPLSVATPPEKVEAMRRRVAARQPGIVIGEYRACFALLARE
jgi:hypothetical protein